MQAFEEWMDGKAVFLDYLKQTNQRFITKTNFFYFAHFQHFSFNSKLKIVQLNLYKTINVFFDLLKMKPDK